MTKTANLKLPALIGDNMVLQQGMKTPIWGWAAPGKVITVSIAGQQPKATANKDGAWRVSIEPLRPGPVLEMTVSDGDKSIAVKNILVGEVWVCSGQSNMSDPSKGDEGAKAKYPDIRLFDVAQATAEAPQQDVKGSWTSCTPQTVDQFSAVSYFFGRKIHQDLGVPVGLIHSSLGATEAESWMDRKVLEADPEFKPIFDFWAHQRKENEDNMAGYAQRLAAWQRAKADGKPALEEPGKPFDWGVRYPGLLYNGMMAPLMPFAIRGVIWYQGESNYVGALYHKEFAALIQCWRKGWGQGDFPFLFVQLPRYGDRKNEPGSSDWAVTRQAQLETLAVPHTAMVETIDFDYAVYIHPPNKHDYGRRLAFAAEATVYGKDVIYSGPICDEMKVVGDNVRLKFKYADGGLVSKDGVPVKGFAVAGADGKFVWAEAKIEGEGVVVSSNNVKSPTRVRYAWADNPECNLCNKAGLPASPFEMPVQPGKAAGGK